MGSVQPEQASVARIDPNAPDPVKGAIAGFAADENKSPADMQKIESDSLAFLEQRIDAHDLRLAAVEAKVGIVVPPVG